jgi:hypothetical protein
VTIDELAAALRKPGDPATSEQVAAFEAEVGTRLPDDYRAFLGVVNGGYLPGWHRYRGAGAGGEERTEYVDSLFGLRRDEPALSLRFHWGCGRDPEAGFPQGLLAVAGDPGGNLFCLRMDGDHRGGVYFWLHDLLPDPDEWDGRVETAENVVLLADSFTTLVAGIAPGGPATED